MQNNKDFLQSKQWREFQESVGRKTHDIGNESSASSADKFSASIIEHNLPIVGKYFYCPRGPIISLDSEEFPISNFQFPNKDQNQISNNQNRGSFKIQNSKFKIDFSELLGLARKNNVGWIRIEPENSEILENIKENISEKIIKAPHDVQPKEIFVVDISKSQEQLLAEMKSKTRYNIGIAQKKGVKILTCHKNDLSCMSAQLAFFQLTKEMAQRQGIISHPEEYYRKMIESLPKEMLQIYVAEFEGKVIAANLVLFYGETAIYLHGSSSSDNRNVMAPFFLQWQAILDSKKRGCTKYDFGGVNTREKGNKWEGITNFKLGFSPETKTIEFPGSYDIIVNPRKYAVYSGLQKAKVFAVKFRR